MIERVIREFDESKIIISGAWSGTVEIKEASKILKSCKKVLDIGSGTGKFCLSAAVLNPDTHFTGVEINPKYWAESIRMKDRLGISNVDFIYCDYKDIDITEYDGIYIFNPFVMSPNDPFGQKYQYGIEQDSDYHEYVNKFKSDLFTANIGTRLVMYNPFCTVARKTGFVQKRFTIDIDTKNTLVSPLRHYIKNGK